MRETIIFLCFYSLLLLGIAPLSAHEKRDTPHGRNPIFEFHENKGQFDQRVLFKSQIPGGALFLENNRWTFHLYDAGLLADLHMGNFSGDLETLQMQHHAYQVTFLNSNANPVVEGSEDQPHFYNYFKGNNPSKWASKVSAFTKVRYNNLYPQIDAELYTYQHNLKYDWMVKPGGDPTQIKWEIEGADQVYEKRGRLYITTSLGEQWEEKPYAYQLVDGQEQEIACKFVVENQQVKFEFPKGYDASLPLIIDPTLVFSTYSGSVSNNFGYTATSDALGFLYSGSTSFGVNYPITTGAFQVNWAGGDGFNGGTNQQGTDVAITKYDTSGTFMIYSTYLGGQGDEMPHSMIVNENNELYVMGTTGSVDFPTSSNAYDDMLAVNPSNAVSLLGGLGVNFVNSCDVFVTKFNANGTGIIGSTFLGGTDVDGLNLASLLKVNYADEVRGEIEIDNLGNVYVVSSTRSQNFPVTANAFQTTKPGPGNNQDGFIAKLSPNLNQLIWSSYIGGTNADAVYSVSIDGNNNPYISGGTASTGFPNTTNAYSNQIAGGVDAFVTHINSTGTAILESTFFGSPNYDQSYFVEVDKQDQVYIFGQTEAVGNTLVINAAYSVPNSGQFITKFTPQLDSVIWSTVFGTGDGDPDISPTAFLVDLCSAVYLSGWGSSIQGGNLSTNGLPVTSGAFQSTTDNNDFYLMVLADDASQLNYASYFGGSAQEHVDGGTSRFDKKGKIYQSVCAGCPNGSQGSSSDFPTLPDPGAVSNSNGAATSNGCNAASFKMDFNLPIVLSDFLAPEAGCAPLTVSFDNISLEQNNTNFSWDFGDGTTSSQFEPTHTYNQAGTYTITLVVSDTGSCNLNDTLVKQISVLADSSSTLPNAVVCPGNGSPIGTVNNPNPNVNYTWIPNTFLSDTSIANPIAFPPTNTQYTLLVDNGICTDTLTQNVLIDSLQLEAFADTVICTSEGPVDLFATNNGNASSYLWSTSANFTDTLNAVLNDSTATVAPPDSINWYYIQSTSLNGCVYEDSIRIRVQDLQEPLQASFDAPSTVCAPFDADLLNTTPLLTNTNFVWQLPDGTTSNLFNESFNFTTAGSYTVNLVAIDTAICDQFDTTSVEILVDVDSNYTVNTFACSNQETPVGINPDTVTGTTYQWIPGDLVSDSIIVNPTVNLENDTSLLLIVDNGICIDTVTQEVDVEQIRADTRDTIIGCSTDLPFTLSGTSEGTATSFIWSSNQPLSDTLNSSFMDSTFEFTSGEAVNTFWFTAETTNGCQQSDELTIVLSDLGITTDTAVIICFGDTVQLEAINAFPANSMRFEWSPIEPVIGSYQNAKVLTAPETTTYFLVEATNDSGCVATETATVIVEGLQGSNIDAYAQDDTIVINQSTELFAEPQQSNVLYNWSPAVSLNDPNSFNPVASPTETTTYTVIITDQESGCEYIRNVRVDVLEIICGEPDIFVPTAFTPDGDGQNDRLFVRGKNIERMTFNVYNSWGEKVFETNDQNRGWDGTHRGIEVNNEVFVYYLEAVCIDGQEYFKKGDVTVIR